MARYCLREANRFLRAYRDPKWTIKEICKKMGMSPSTLYSWKDTHPEFRIKVEKAYETRNTLSGEMAESALWKKLSGYEVELTHTVCDTKMVDGEEVVVKKSKRVEKKYYAPDTIAILFALKNAEDKNYSDSKQITHSREVAWTDFIDSDANTLDVVGEIVEPPEELPPGAAE